MITIWKFPFEITDDVTINMPDDALIIHVGAPGDEPHVWAIVDTKNPVRPHHFALAGTGHPLPPGNVICGLNTNNPLHYAAGHVATFTSHGGQFVWHLFSRLDK
jgi:hypothetical protein